MSYRTMFRATIPDSALPIPEDVQKHLEGLRGLQRFHAIDKDTNQPIYPEGAISDNVLEHTIRCVQLTDTFPLPYQSVQTTCRILWRHDVPEVDPNVKEIPNVIKNEMEHNEKLTYEKNERSAAKQLLSEEGYRDWVMYEVASTWLKQKIQAPRELRFEPLSAKVIDLIDGFRIFHSDLSFWTSSNWYNPDTMPKDEYLIYGFRSCQSAISKLMMLKSVPSLSRGTQETYVLAKLLKDHMEYAKADWRSIVDQVRVPKVIRSF